jgi:hypothetical protein
MGDAAGHGNRFREPHRRSGAGPGRGEPGREGRGQPVVPVVTVETIAEPKPK